MSLHELQSIPNGNLNTLGERGPAIGQMLDHVVGGNVMPHVVSHSYSHIE